MVGSIVRSFKKPLVPSGFFDQIDHLILVFHDRPVGVVLSHEDIHSEPGRKLYKELDSTPFIESPGKLALDFGVIDHIVVD